MGRIILGAFLLLAAPIAFADSLTGKVVKITDGDALYVLDANYKEHKIRLAGIRRATVASVRLQRIC